MVGRAAWVLSDRGVDLGKGGVKLAAFGVWIGLVMFSIGFKLLRGDGGGRWRHAIMTVLAVPFALFAALGMASVWSTIPVLVAGLWVVSLVALFTPAASRFFEGGQPAE